MNSVEILKEEILKAQKNGDIASLYVLERRAHEVFDEDTLGSYYANILDLALERLTDTLESHRAMDMEEVQDFATLRALYEYAIENYSAGKISDASALFEVLSGLSNSNEFSDALKIHALASEKDISLDNFIDNIADLDATSEAGTFYISCFKTKEAQKLLENSQIDGE
ncbi:hypothetical protein Suden_0758 [Sulfurimonas denitrificans DSM 1251]|uniref:Uncharacterized protein n=1 Tax=Sulfurimonas denitrificans (strain ATCC 33889 / DSM 1251) TaxID=326298 RepID=Q30SJ4_SULDN|nr:hypothetical protein [Sulfurimonas denitrificans]ABB44037.1 hypothetical protein Suden_0758 [Sulfurimonas denitrificans DSM 1251]MDD3443397.1 hypothetical protein [Sulfurimonas denitrificans]